jgi:protein-disulfide isomerase
MKVKTALTAFVSAVLAIVAVETYHRYAPSAAGGGLTRSEVPGLIREYILKNPEILQEAMAELEKKQSVAETEKARGAIKEMGKEIFNSPRQVTVGNREGDVTLVEFFDYNCGYCKQALTDLNSLMSNDGKLRVVLKEFPVLGPGSIEAAQVGVALRMQDPSGEKYLAFHQKMLGSRGQADKARSMAAAADVGADMARLEADLASDEIKKTIEENFKLAEALGINGTPSYVVGNDLVVGAAGLETLKTKIKQARGG